MNRRRVQGFDLDGEREELVSYLIDLVESEALSSEEKGTSNGEDIEAAKTACAQAARRLGIHLYPEWLNEAARRLTVSR